MPQPNLTLPYNSTGRGRSRETSPASRVGRQNFEDGIASEASATPLPPVIFLHDTLQQLTGSVFALLKDSLGGMIQEIAQQQLQHQQQQEQQQQQFLQVAAQQIQQQGQQQQQHQQQQQQQQAGRRNPKLPTFNTTDIDLWIGAVG